MRNAVVLVLLSLAGCAAIHLQTINGSGTLASEDRSIENFTTLVTSTPIDVDVVCGQEASLSITVDDNLLPLIETTVQNGTLTISCSAAVSPTSGSGIRITVPELSTINCVASATVHVSGMKTDNASVEITGSGAVSGDVESKSLTVRISGSGDIDMTGAVDEVDTTVTGSGAAVLQKIVSRESSVSITGSGNVSVQVTEQLDVGITGSGSVEYSGSPTRVTQRVTGSGSVQKVSE